MLQSIAWVMSFRPSSPNSAYGFRSAMPNGPSRRKPIGSHPDFANDGSSSVYSQTANPVPRPASAPARVAPFQ